MEALHPWPRHIVLHIPTSQPDNIHSNRVRDQQLVLIVIIWLQFQCFKMVLEINQFGNYFWLQVLCRNVLIVCVLQSSPSSNIRLENRWIACVFVCLPHGPYSGVFLWGTSVQLLIGHPHILSLDSTVWMRLCHQWSTHSLALGLSFAPALEVGSWCWLTYFWLRCCHVLEQTMW